MWLGLAYTKEVSTWTNVADDLVDVLMKEEFGLSDNSIKAVILVRL